MHVLVLRGDQNLEGMGVMQDVDVLVNVGVAIAYDAFGGLILWG